MDFKVVATGKALGAVRALVVALTRVNKLVTLQVARVSEHQIALIALIRLLLGVRPRVRC